MDVPLLIAVHQSVRISSRRGWPEEKVQVPYVHVVPTVMSCT